MKFSALFVLGVLTGSITGILGDSSSSSSSSSSSEEGGGSCSSQTGPPNIVVFMGDALGWDDLSWHNNDVETPFLEGLADNGVRLEEYYTHGHPTPSRSSFFTGFYPFRIGRQHEGISGLKADCLDLDSKILPQYLKDLGYATHLVGRWALGFCKLACTPRLRGFDTFYGHYGSVGDHYAHELIGVYDWRENEDLDFSARGRYAAELITDRSLDIINAHDCNDPLYLNIGYPIAGNADTTVPPGEESVWDPAQGEDTPNERTDYLKMLKYMDGSVEQVVEALQNRGLYDNTVFIFTSDSGGMMYRATSNRPLRGGQHGSYEGGTKVVTVVNSPLMTNTGRVSYKLMQVEDWVPTILSLAGSLDDLCKYEGPTILSLTGSKADLPDLDGIDQSDMLMNGGPSVRDEIVYSIDVQAPFSFGAGVLRMGDFKIIEGYPGGFDGWKQDENQCLTFLIDLLDVSTTYPLAGQQFPCESLGGPGTPRPSAEIAQYADDAIGNVMLFNLSVDPEERNDISDSPDPAIQAQKQAMLDRLEELKALATPDRFPEIPDACDPRITGNDNWEVGCCDSIDI